MPNRSPNALLLAALIPFGCGSSDNPHSDAGDQDAGLSDRGLEGDAGDLDFELSVSVNSARNTTGGLCFAVFRDGRGYPDDGDQAVANGCVPMTAQPARVRLTPGRYGVSVFHDANSNETLDTGFLGIPTEGYGFSNDAAGSFGAPSWEDVAFDLDGDRALDLKLTYF